MSSESEKERERLIQAAKIFSLRIRDLISFINRLIELFNLTMKTQILPVDLKEDSCIKEFFEQIIKNFKEMQLRVDANAKQMQMEPLCPTVTAVVVEKCASVDPQHAAKEMLKNVQAPAAATVMNSSSILGSLESSLSLLTKFPIMDLQLCDFHREETEEQSGVTSSDKSTKPAPVKAATVDSLKKLQDALRTENVLKPVEAAADQLEQFAKTMEPALQVLQKAIKTIEGDISTHREVGDK